MRRPQNKPTHPSVCPDEPCLAPWFGPELASFKGQATFVYREKLLRTKARRRGVMTVKITLVVAVTILMAAPLLAASCPTYPLAVPLPAEGTPRNLIMAAVEDAKAMLSKVFFFFFFFFGVVICFASLRWQPGALIFHPLPFVHVFEPPILSGCQLQQVSWNGCFHRLRPGLWASGCEEA